MDKLESRFNFVYFLIQHFGNKKIANSCLSVLLFAVEFSI